MKKTRSVDEYIANETVWQAELAELRDILRQTKLTETVKWGAPCYTAHGQNVVGIMAFKTYFGLWFHQGVFMADKDGVLINAQPGTTKALRQWRMTRPEDIKPAMIIHYVNEAIGIARDGKSIKPAKKKLIMPPELSEALNADETIKAAFNNLPPSHQREYADWISEAKKDETKQRRLAKALPMIAQAKGLNDKYR